MYIENLIDEYLIERHDFREKLKNRIKEFVGDDVYSEFLFIEFVPERNRIIYCWNNLYFYVEKPMPITRANEDYLIFGYNDYSVWMYIHNTTDGDKKSTRIKLGNFFNKLSKS